MLLLTLLLSLALAAFFTLLPARVLHRRTTRADLYAGAGAAVLVWLWAASVWSKPGLTVDFDDFRLAALLAMLNSCASGVSVVNIDNGFGAGFLASRINHMGGQA